MSRHTGILERQAIRFRRLHARRPARVASLCLALAFCHARVAFAVELLNDGDTELRWDNTLTYSGAVRLDRRDPLLLANQNADDGDRNFAPGPISNRFDIVSQLDFSKSWLGVEASVAAWYDTIYHQRNANDSVATFNPVTVSNNEFTKAVRDLQGGKVELINAFLHGDTQLFGAPFSFRIGRYTLLWGESLFFPENGIAAGQAPADVNKVLGRPTSYAKNVFMPVAQASGSIQLPGGPVIEAYYQFEWRKTRLPGSGSYFSIADYADAGGERYLAGSGKYWYRDPDLTPPDSGQYGAALRWSLGQVDYGLYALRFNAKDPQVYYKPSVIQGALPANSELPLFYVTPGKIGTYQLVYPQGIELYGLSASFYLADSSVAAEMSVRRHAPLPSGFLVEAPGHPADASKNPLYAIGNSLNAQVSSTTTFARNSLWDSANLDAEVALDQRLDVTKNAAALDRRRGASAVAFRASFEPTYFQVLPNLDLTLSFGLGFDPGGDAGVDPYQSGGGGDLDVSLTATYRVVWSASAGLSHFLGGAYRQPLADRDFLSFSVQRTF